MQLTPAQLASLRRMQRYRAASPGMRERIRMAAVFALLLLIPVTLAGFLLLQLDVPGAVFLMLGLYLGAVAREIGLQRLFVAMWPMTREITNWEKVDELAAAPEVSPVPRKTNVRFAVTLGIALFALAFVGMIGIERALVFAHHPVRDNPPDNVIMLSASWCGYCMSLRKHLAESNIPYTDLDVERTTEGQWAYRAVRGSGIPITIVGEHVIRGIGLPDARWRRIDDALARAGYQGVNSSAGIGPQREEEILVSPLAQ